MKKNRLLVFALVFLLIISAVSIGFNIRHTSEQGRIRRNMINHAYSDLTGISFDLDGLLYNIENGITTDESNRLTVSVLSHRFVSLDSTLARYVYYFPSEKLYYGGTFDFNYIAYTLTSGTGTANGMPYAGVMSDNDISEAELRYLTILRDDINLIVADMVSTEISPQENQNLTISQLNRVLSAFFDKWSYHNEDSPYFLLRSE